MKRFFAAFIAGMMLVSFGSTAMAADEVAEKIVSESGSQTEAIKDAPKTQDIPIDATDMSKVEEAIETYQVEKETAEAMRDYAKACEDGKTTEDKMILQTSYNPRTRAYG